MTINFFCDRYDKAVDLQVCKTCRWRVACPIKREAIMWTVLASILFMMIWVIVAALVYAALVNRGI